MTAKKILYSVAIFILIVFSSLNDMVGAGAVLLMYAGVAICPKKSELRLGVPCICIAAVVLLTLLAGIINNSSMYDSCVACVKLSALGIPFLLKKDFVKEWFLPNVYAAISAAAVVSIGLYIVRLIAYNGYGDVRMQSVIGYANSSCVLFLTGVYLSVCYIKRGFVKRCIPAAAVCAAAAVLTFSRLGFSCFAFSLMMYVFFKYPRSRHYIVMVLLTAAVVGAALVISGYYKTQLGSTMVSRIECWTDAAAVILKKPFGIGAGTWKELQYSVQSADYSIFQIHNSFLQIMLDGGIAAFAAFAVFAVYVVRRSEKDTLITAAAVMLFAHAFVDMDFYYICIPFTLGAVLRSEYEDKVFGGAYMWIYAVIGALICVGVYVFDSTDNNYVKKLSAECRRGHMTGDSKNMYELSAELVRLAPKQRESYELYRKVYMQYYRKNKEGSDGKWRLYTNGKDITLAAPPVELDNKIMIPVRTAAERFGCEVTWDNVSQTMTVSKNGSVVSTAKVKNKIRRGENGALTHDVGEVFVVGNRLMVQCDKLGEYLPVSVTVNADAMAVYIEGT